MVYGYSRVSTRGQEIDGNSLEAQEKLLRENGATEIYSDIFTGVKSDRPNLNILMDKLKCGDALIVTKLDRIARSLQQGSILINSLLQKDIRIHILNIGVLDNTPSSKLIRNIFFAFSEFERDMIVERTQEGKAIAKQKITYIEGRPKKFNRAQINHALSLLETNSYKAVSEMTGISKSTIARAKKGSD